ncbi:MAG: gliding motility-associated C-terminal domain-containing protein, partial [Flavobacteriales bacterium]
NYNWSTGSNEQSIEVSESGIYTLELSLLGCTSFAAAEVEVFEFIPLDAIEIPNVFTPNGDDKNSRFTVFSPYFPDLEICSFPNIETSMQIYNRWGNLVTENECFWDGRTEGGDDMSDGVYYYIIDIKSQCLDRSEEEERAGSVTLLR